MKKLNLKIALPLLLFTILQFPLVSRAQYTNSTITHPKTWKFNSGLDLGAWWGGTGVSPLEPSSNPLVKSHLPFQVAYSGDIYLEWLHKNNNPGLVGPNLGIKTKLVWDYFTANNGGSGYNAESLTLNYINIPVLFEYCISFKNKVTQPHYISPTSNSQTSVYDHGYYSHIITTTTRTPGGYYPGGVPYTNAIFIYAGPQLCYLARGFHRLNGVESVDTDPLLQKTTMGLIGGISFYLANINLDISYQHSLTSIYSGKNVYVTGFIFSIGFNLTQRKF